MSSWIDGLLVTSWLAYGMVGWPGLLIAPLPVYPCFLGYETSGSGRPLLVRQGSLPGGEREPVGEGRERGVRGGALCSEACPGCPVRDGRNGKQRHGTMQVCTVREAGERICNP